MDILGYIGALVIGFSLGIIGGGGSILTVPVLAYFFAVNPVMATAYSLFIVGITALAGAIRNMQLGLIDYKTSIVFSIPSFIAVYLTRRYLLPAIPSEIMDMGGLVLTKDIAIMLLFGLLMISSAYFMIKKSNIPQSIDNTGSKKFNHLMIILEGSFVGMITGLVGAGGGFLIVPALVLLARLPMKIAIGSSLLIIALKSLIGFLGDIGAGREIDWVFLTVLSLLAIGGVLVGNYVSRFVESKKLKTGFGWFVMVVGVYMIINELIL